MPCNHLGPIEIMQMAEEHLRAGDVPEDRWDGTVFGWGENVTGSQWTSVYTEIEHRGGSWVVTKIDRRTEPIGSDEGLREKKPEEQAGSQ